MKCAPASLNITRKPS